MKLTGARRRALAVLDHGGRRQQIVRVSNATTAPDRLDGTKDLTVYWQTADGLVGERLATIAAGHTQVITLTATGIRAAAEATA